MSKSIPPVPSRLLLIDGTAQLYRAFYAIRELTDPQGRPVNMVYGFAQTWLNLLERYRPTHALAVFDRPEPTHRHQAFPGYKAHRPETPEGLVQQIPLVQRLLDAFALPRVELPGWEADDLLATLARHAQAAGVEVLILTSDKDLFQLVGTGINLLRPQRGGEYEILDPAGVEAAFGVPPQQVREVLALMGDASDNIPGVPGVGEKTAVDLIKTFGSVEQVFARLDEVKSEKMRAKLGAHREQVKEARALISLREDAPYPWDPEQGRVPAAVPEPAYAFMAELGFKRLLFRQAQTVQAPVAAWTEGLRSTDTLDTILAAARVAKQVMIEWQPQGMGLAVDTQSAVWIPLGPGACEAALAAPAPWVQLLCDPLVKKVGYDLKPLAVALLRGKKVLSGPLEDLHLAAHLLDLPANRPQDFVSRLLGGPAPPEHPEWAACAYALIVRGLPAKLEEQKAGSIYRELELPLLPVLAQMEAEGVAIDAEALRAMAERLGKTLDSLEHEIQDMAGVEFNVRSTQQLAEVLFERLQLSPGRKTKSGRSTSVEVLEALAAEHPLPARVLEYRQLQKLKSTYLDVLPDLIDPRDQRVHTTFHQVGAATGRLSSSDPNLQNIPVRTELGQALRAAFVAGRPGHALLSADYSQIELRLLAHLSQDEAMITDFKQGHDIHRATAAEIFKVRPEQVTIDMRRAAKTSNFGIAYGVTPYGLSRQLGIPPQEAKGYIESFYQRYPKVRDYIQSALTVAREKGYVETLLGRRRAVPELLSANRNLREAAERMATNAPLQGSAADLIKRAMVQLAVELKAQAFSSRLILQVHDELVLEGPEDEMPRLKTLVIDCMRQVHPLRVPLEVDAAWGHSWKDAHA